MWHLSARRKILFPEIRGITLSAAIFCLQKNEGQDQQNFPEAGLMKTEVKSLWAATQVFISEKEEEDSAPQNAEKGGKPEGGTLTAMSMEESWNKQS